MVRTRTVQTSFLSGVLDPRAAGRVDTDAYNNGLLTGTNVIVNHLGGAFRRPGLKFLLQLPNTLTYVTPDSATVPEGGIAARGFDDDDSTLVVTTGNIGTVDPYIVIRYDLGSAKAISHADVIKFKSTGSTSAEFRIQSSTDDAAWTDFGNVLPKIDTIERTYRRTPLSAGAFSTVTARYWRVVKIGGTTMSTNTVSLAGFDLWQDSGTVGNVRLFSFELTTETRYLVVVTDRSATFFLNGVIPTDGTVPLPYVSADISELDGAVGADALMFTHEDYPFRFIAEEFSGADFQTAEFSFTSVPQFDFNDTSSPTPTSEVQAIVFDVEWKQGDTFQIELDGARTALVSYAGDATANERTTTSANIAREVQKLFSVPGFTGVTCARTGVRTFTVTLAGESAKAYDGLMTVSIGTVVSSTAVSPTVSRSVAGVSRAEDAWSSTRGYPRTVAFFGGRLYFGGTRDKLQTLFGSTVNDINTFDQEEALDADPIFLTLDGQQLNAINALFSGRSLEIFTSGNELRYVRPRGDPITPADQPTAQTQYGTKKVRPISIDGGTIFIQRLGKSVRDFRFNFEEDAYDSVGLSSLAPNLLNGVIDMAAWQGSSTDEINLVYFINTDGTLGLLNLRKDAEVRAWTRWTTTGTFKAVATTVEEVYFAVQRSVNGANKLFLEQTDEDMYVDSGVNVVGGVVNNVVHLNSETCRVRLQTIHHVLTDQTGGTVTPSEAEFAASSIQVGLDFDPTVTPMPLASLTPTGSNFLDKRRVRKARVKVRNTLGLLVNGRPLADRSFDVDDFDVAKTPFSGNHALEETSNWDETEDKLIIFTQVDPLPMEILSISVDMESA